MSQEKENGKIILIATIICVLVGIGFVFRLDQKIGDLFKTKNIPQNQIIDVSSDPELQNLPELPNMIVVYLGDFLTKEITVKEGDVVTFYNVDSNPAKIIGDGWQSSYIDKTGAFAKGDLKKGEYVVYLDGKPQSTFKIIVK